MQMEGGRVITFNATKNRRITKNLSLVWGGSEGFGTHEGYSKFFSAGNLERENKKTSPVLVKKQRH